MRVAVLKWFSKRKDWLLVVDNADNLGSVMAQRCLPDSRACGHVLLSTREGPSVLEQHGFTRITELKHLDTQSATLLLFRCLTRHQQFASDTDAAAVLNETTSAEFRQALVNLAGPLGLDGFPLAIVQVSRHSTFVFCFVGGRALHN